MGTRHLSLISEIDGLTRGLEPCWRSGLGTGDFRGSSDPQALLFDCFMSTRQNNADMQQSEWRRIRSLSCVGRFMRLNLVDEESCSNGNVMTPLSLCKRGVVHLSLDSAVCTLWAFTEYGGTKICWVLVAAHEHCGCHTMSGVNIQSRVCKVGTDDESLKTANVETDGDNSFEIKKEGTKKTEQKTWKRRSWDKNNCWGEAKNSGSRRKDRCLQERETIGVPLFGDISKYSGTTSTCKMKNNTVNTVHSSPQQKRRIENTVHPECDSRQIMMDGKLLAKTH